MPVYDERMKEQQSHFPFYGVRRALEALKKAGLGCERCENLEKLEIQLYQMSAADFGFEGANMEDYACTCQSK